MLWLPKYTCGLTYRVDTWPGYDLLMSNQNTNIYDLLFVEREICYISNFFFYVFVKDALTFSVCHKDHLQFLFVFIKKEL